MTDARHAAPGDWAAGTSLRGLIAAHAAATPDAPAILGLDREPLTYAGLLVFIDELGRGLHAAGLGRGDRVAMVLPDGPEMATAFLAVGSWTSCAPLNPGYRESELEFYLGDLHARAVMLPVGGGDAARAVASRMEIPVLDVAPAAAGHAGNFELLGSVAGAPADVAPAGGDDVLLRLHTSGTTSRPKLVPLTHANVCASAATIAASLTLAPADRCLVVMPLFHVHGLIGTLLSSLAAGASVACPPGFLAARFLDWVERWAPTWTSAVPTMLQAILERVQEAGGPPPGSRFRFVRSCSAALPPRLAPALETAIGAPVIEAYGMTEASHQMTANPLPPRERKAGSVGLATGVEVGIMDAAGGLLAAGAAGEVVIRGLSVTAGYEANLEANASAFTEGWFRTGDLGRLDADGYLFLLGRLKEVINRGGEKFSPREVDEVLLDHPAVLQAVAFAVPHPRLGEDVAAAVVLRPGATATSEQLRELAAARLAGFKVPRRIVIVEAIPKGPTGKLQRIGLAERLGVRAEAASRAPFVAPRTPIEEAVAAVWREVLKVPRVGADDSFLDLGGDSILVTLAVSRLSATLSVDLPIASALERPTLADWALAIAESLLARLGGDEAERLVAGLADQHRAAPPGAE
jgi:acyl-CoA synthetase (AMP-forming)/AMP-acid ligase II